MAVIQTEPAAEVCAGISVSVTIEGRLLHEYNTNNDDVKHVLPHIAMYQKGVTVTKYIESTSGKSFGVSFMVQKPFKMEGYTQLGFATFVDGKKIGAPMMRKDIFETDGKCTWQSVMRGPIKKVDGVYDEGQTMFGAINTSKSIFYIIISLADFAIRIVSGSIATADLKAAVDSISQIGEIAVFVYKLGSKEVLNQESKTISSALDADTKVHSKALILELKSHCMV